MFFCNTLCYYCFTGVLQPVSSVQHTSVGNNYNISWSAPFSIDVPSADPDITYCINIYEQFSSVQVLLKCDINDTFLILSNTTYCNDLVVQIIATNLAGNSTTSTTDLQVKG